MGRDSKENPSMYAIPLTDGMYHGIPRYYGTMGWDRQEGPSM